MQIHSVPNNILMAKSFWENHHYFVPPIHRVTATVRLVADNAIASGEWHASHAPS